jgi:hypothetical protein
MLPQRTRDQSNLQAYLWESGDPTGKTSPVNPVAAFSVSGLTFIHDVRASE